MTMKFHPIVILGFIFAVNGFSFGSSSGSYQAHKTRSKLVSRDAATADQTATLKRVLLTFQRAAWEQGTASQALIELEYPQYSEFSANPFQSGSATPDDVILLAHDAVVRQASDGRLALQISGQDDNVALDPASNGEAVIIASRTSDDSTGFWRHAADAQLNYLLNVAPRAPDGTISHRSDRIAFWADGVYMGAPFLAYYGATHNNYTLLQLAFDQIRLYHQYLYDPNTTLWRHIYDYQNGNFTDPGYWATGNAWALAGMSRVLASITQSSYSANMTAQKGNLTAWIQETLDGVVKYQQQDGLFRNYLDQTTSFEDASASALFAYSIYRANSLDSNMFGSNYTSKADAARNGVLSSINYLGFVSPVVNANSYTQQGESSPEAQSFALLMIAADRDRSAGNTTTVGTVGTGGIASGSAAAKFLKNPTALAVGAGASALVANYVESL